MNHFPGHHPSYDDYYPPQYNQQGEIFQHQYDYPQQRSHHSYPPQNLNPSIQSFQDNRRQKPKKGLLAQMFNRKQTRNIPSIPTTERAVGGVSNTLNNIQQVLKIVQSTTPIIQEYGPMVKNLPVMFRLMKAVKKMDTVDDSPPPTSKSSPSDAKGYTEPSNNNSKQSNSKLNAVTSTHDGESHPKLFISN